MQSQPLSSQVINVDYPSKKLSAYQVLLYLYQTSGVTVIRRTGPTTRGATTKAISLKESVTHTNTIYAAASPMGCGRCSTSMSVRKWMQTGSGLLGMDRFVDSGA